MLALYAINRQIDALRGSWKTPLIKLSPSCFDRSAMVPRAGVEPARPFRDKRRILEQRV